MQKLVLRHSLLCMLTKTPCPALVPFTSQICVSIGEDMEAEGNVLSPREESVLQNAVLSISLKAES